MRTTTLRTTVVALVTGALLSTPLAVASAGEHGRGLDAVGLVDGTSLVSFTTADTRTRDSRDITGLDGDATIVGIDFRVQDGLLYGVGDAGGIYTLDDGARATEVGQLTVALTGESFGVDFNPAANALRIVGDDGQNLRQPLAMAGAPTVEDGPLTDPATPPATDPVPATGVTGAGYTNNDLDTSTATTLFVLDTANDRISLQSPANAGTLAPTGGLGVDAGPQAGFDVFSDLYSGVSRDVRAFAALEVDGHRALYEIDLLTGQADRIGDLGDVGDIAVRLDD